MKKESTNLRLNNKKSVSEKKRNPSTPAHECTTTRQFSNSSPMMQQPAIHDIQNKRVPI